MTSLARAREAISLLSDVSRLAPGIQPDANLRARMLDWPGWGPLSGVFDAASPAMADLNDELRTMLDDAAWKAARRNLDTSFYTPTHVIDAVYAVLDAAGIRAGRFLDPGCGTGRFAERIPAGWDVRYVGVEIDPTPAGIAARLHPRASIVTSALEKASLGSGMSAVIGNVPFSSAHVYDGALSGALHDYVIARGVKLLREGGYLVVVTSRHSMDARGLSRMKESADFVGALRLPVGTFEGTGVVADIVVLRKNTTGETSGWSDFTPKAQPGERRWERDTWGRQVEKTTAYDPGADVSTLVNGYWAAHPGHVAGTMRATGFSRLPVSVDSDDREADTSAALAHLLSVVRAMPPVWSNPLPAADGEETDDEAGALSRAAIRLVENKVVLDGTVLDIDLTEFARLVAKDGSYREVGGRVYRAEAGTLVPVQRTGAELSALMRLRDLSVALLDAETDVDAPDASMADLRTSALDAYTDYVKAYGPLNRGTMHEGAIDPETGAPKMTWRRPKLGGFRTDPDFFTVMALEVFDQSDGSARPATLLLTRVNRRPQRVRSAASAAEAVSISMGESGRVDLDRIAGLLGLPDAAAAMATLGDLAYRDPDTDRILPARVYLSGNIAAKLERARDVASRDATFVRNVGALEAVMPTPLGPLDVRIYLGSVCTKTSDVSGFVKEVLGTSVSVSHCAKTATWEVDGYGGRNPEAALTYGTDRLSPVELVTYALNGKPPIVYDDLYDPDTRTSRRVRNAADSMAAQEKLNLLQARFTEWLWSDDARSRRVCAEYNRRFNSFVDYAPDGSYLRFAHMSPDFEPYPHQLDMVDRALNVPGVLCGHEMGLGKTAEMCLVAMALRQFGLVRKPMITVPNHLLEQISREMRQMFPLGRFLVAGHEDLSGAARRSFAARCATAEWDAVVITHASFTALPVHPRTEMAFVESQADELDDALRASGRSSKSIARRLRSHDTRMAALRANGNGDPGAIYFDHLGIDYLIVDEADCFKRLPIVSRTDGFSMGASKRATDLLVKIRSIAAARPGAPFAMLATGTPWTNTLVETYMWMYYLDYDGLVHAGVESFDAWAAMFVRFETVVEVSLDGSGFRAATRPTKLVNISSLRQMISPFVSVLSGEQVGIVRPGAERETVSVDPSSGQSAFVAALAKKAESPNAAANGGMLQMCTLGSLVALDPNLVGIEDDEPAKIAAAADRMSASYHAGRTKAFPGYERPGTLLVAFCDSGTPGPKGPQTYGRLRDALISRGVPREVIRFVHEAKDDKSRAALFASCRDGSTAVLVASTAKGGLGTNIQDRLAEIHHLDLPWRPSDLSQRDFRGLRPGNLNETVKIVRYVTTRTFDAFRAQALERKALAFAIMYSNDRTVREVEDIGDVVPSYTELKAMATGNPLLLEQAAAAAEVSRLRMLRSVDAATVNKMSAAAREASERIAGLRRSIERSETVSELAATPGTGEPEGTDGLHEAVSTLLSRTEIRVGYEMATTTYSPRISWRGMMLSIEGAGERHPQLSLSVSWSGAGSVSLPGRTRFGAKATRSSTEAAVAAVREWLDGAQKRRAAWQSQASELEADVARFEAAIEDHVFDRAGDLHAAERALTEIEQRIAAQVEPPAQVVSIGEPEAAGERELVGV